MKDPVTIVQEAGWAAGPVQTSAEKSRPPPGFDLRTVQLVVSRYTDRAIPAHIGLSMMSEIEIKIFNPMFIGPCIILIVE